eukprot:CAMPEP_0194769060 /NCGR_PEP_ID=MMETSP0323_2-20130528/41750_1 /TAXON_ID=2866 ORGANISM="Crypthecodinium cohnii, Strain Seligo" /NCGR_SAMPLE_ID=MMETSP0323_2 /ASSEMBLY_ACC=CAM_ASM_000346 /LENGTH=76 /DNA_ID=CAMNT_0039701811 /DNA_START=60 /DNA_END=290 /DNA_ORIENTATION=-
MADIEDLLGAHPLIKVFVLWVFLVIIYFALKESRAQREEEENELQVRWDKLVKEHQEPFTNPIETRAKEKADKKSD